MKTEKNDIENTIYEILSGREERVRTRDKHLSDNVFACQITINVPGYPKRIRNDEMLLDISGREFIEKWGSVPLHENKITNAAGLCWVGFFAGDIHEAQKAKKIAVGIEEMTPAGRILDMDIIVPEKTISRSDLGLPHRNCLLCEKPAKECARDRSHSYEDLRTAIEKLIKNL